jgi:hypothetical protein
VIFRSPSEANQASISAVVTGMMSKRGWEVTMAMFARLDDQALEGIEAGDEEILEVEPLQIFQRGGFPQVEAAGVLRGRYEGQLDAGTETEDAVAGDLEVAVGGLVMEQLMFLSATDDFLGRSAGFSRRPRRSAH